LQLTETFEGGRKFVPLSAQSEEIKAPSETGPFEDLAARLQQLYSPTGSIWLQPVFPEQN
jgi:hypothetical protein